MSASGAARRLAEGLTRSVRTHDALPEGSAAVALTFDDGPSATYTSQVLDVLADLGVRATFFLVGRLVTEHPGLVRRIVAEGHAVGSHSWSHPEPWTVDLRTLAGEYRGGRRALERVLGRRATLFRPPKGHIDARGALAILASRLRTWRWTIDPEDWAPGATSEGLVAGVASAGAGDVVLLHDGLEGALAPEANDRSATVDALPEIVAGIRGRGLELVRLPEPRAGSPGAHR